MSDKRMLGLLKKVDLESHGYKKEVTIKLVSESGSVKPLYEKSYLYYKEIACSKLREIEQELQTMLPGNFEYLITLHEKGKVKKKLLHNRILLILVLSC